MDTNDLTASEIANLVASKPTPMTVYNWARKGVVRNGTRIKLAHTRVGGKVLFTRDGLNEFLRRLNEE